MSLWRGEKICDLARSMCRIFLHRVYHQSRMNASDAVFIRTQSRVNDAKKSSFETAVPVLRKALLRGTSFGRLGLQLKDGRLLEVPHFPNSEAREILSLEINSRAEFTQHAKKEKLHPGHRRKCRQ